MLIDFIEFSRDGRIVAERCRMQLGSANEKRFVEYKIRMASEYLLRKKERCRQPLAQKAEMEFVVGFVQK